MVKLFRETPPLETVIATLKELGFTGISDAKMFSAEEIKMDTLEAWAPNLRALLFAV
jgi:hypothetical protein